MNFLFLEPFYGGSHREFANGLIANSQHRIKLVSLPARFWKWRMRGASLHFIHHISDSIFYDGIITSSLLSLADLKALIGPACPPTLVYFHENQLTYPLASGERMDFQYGFTNITTALCADRILFNSHSHLDSFLKQIPKFIGHMPEYRPFWVSEAIADKAKVLAPGCDFDTIPVILPPSSLNLNPPLIIWNHRWEFDKNPDEFFFVLDRIQSKGIEFRLALLGERFTRIPRSFKVARKKLGKKIVHWGYLPNRKSYYQLLAKGAIVISTAIQENFGLAIVEAIRMGCLPLLPQRLCYPEILPQQFHSDFLYSTTEELIEKTNDLLTNYPKYQSVRDQLSKAMQSYAWSQMIAEYDAELTELKPNLRHKSNL
ncbi:MAG: DUF3524 domain-containing protein [Desulfobacteraceae bacterium]|jgi:glycosyltransferase involved in cell wall biosynthesis